MRNEHLPRKIATFAAVVVVAFASGWSSLGLSAGFVLAMALGAGVAAPIFSERPGKLGSCSVRRRGRANVK